MNSESNFGCCKLCNSSISLSQSNNLMMRIHGQGDYSAKASENKCIQLNYEREKKTRKFREAIKSPTKPEETKKNADEHCYCFSNNDFPDKPRHETKEEKIDFNEKNYFWDSSQPNWKSANERHSYSEQFKRNYSKSSPRNFSEFEEKVDFLFRIFKVSDHKPEDYSERQMTTVLKDFFNLLDFNKRLSMAEEGIEKLTIIIEDLVRKKAIENFCNGEQVNFEELSVSQKITYLKSKNDLMLGFLKTFLKSGSFEDCCSKESKLFQSHSKPVNKFDGTPKSPKLNFESSQNMKDLKPDGIMETLKKLRLEIQETRPQKVFNEHLKSKEISRNKLEVISEQAELYLKDEIKSGENEFKGNSEFRSLQEKLSETENGSSELPLSVTSRILAEEAEYLKTSIDKVHFELFSKPDSVIKKLGDVSKIKIPFSCENKKSDVDANFDSSSEMSSVFWTDECVDKSSELDSSSIFGKFLHQKEIKGQSQQRELEKKPKEYCKQGHTHSDSKLQNICRIPQKSSLVLSNKENRSASPKREVRSLRSAIEMNRETLPKEQKDRPMTDPNARKKPLSPSGLKPLPQEKCSAKNSGTNNVKNKNKILLSKKSCVETS